MNTLVEKADQVSQFLRGSEEINRQRREIESMMSIIASKMGQHLLEARKRQL